MSALGPVGPGGRLLWSTSGAIAPETLLLACRGGDSPGA